MEDALPRMKLKPRAQRHTRVKMRSTRPEIGVERWKHSNARKKKTIIRDVIRLELLLSFMQNMSEQKLLDVVHCKAANSP
jgi:hypothetical protein